MTFFGCLKPDTRIEQLIGVRRVPLCNLEPKIYRDASSPPCLEIDCQQLTFQQICALANDLLDQWQTEIKSLEVAYNYCLEGLPVPMCAFTAVECDELLDIPKVVDFNLQYYCNELNLTVNFD